MAWKPNNHGKWKKPIGEWEAEQLPKKRLTPQERNTFSTEEVPEKAILVSVCANGTTMERTQECLNELAFLLDTAGGIPVKQVIQKLDRPDTRTYVGSGKLEEIKEYKNALDVDFLVFDDELSPAQLRNLEREFECRILDRTTLILDIFAKRARTSIAKTQVELAQLQYMLLKEKLRDIDKQKVQQRKNRESLVRVALVGYTNVGKSTLMNLLSKSDVFAENKLFATLDTTVRKVVLGNLPFLLTDTVGFIRKLPHGLVESFKSTLDEVCEADLLMHVVDISHPDYEEQINAVNRTLEEIGANNKPTILVFNKIDAYTFIEKEEDDLTPMTKANWTLEMLQDSWMAKQAECGDTLHTLFISAANRENIDALRDVMYEEVKKIHAVRYPYNNFLY